MMDPQLQRVLEKIVQNRGTSGLTEADRRVIRRVVVNESEREEERPSPIWRWCRRSEFRFAAAFDSHEFPRFEDDVLPLLIDAGAPADGLQTPSSRATTSVGRKALVRSVRRQLSDKDANQRAVAARLVGFAELVELREMLEEALRSDLEQQRDSNPQVVAASLDSLTMLDSPVAREQGLRFLDASDRMLQDAALRALLFSNEPLDDALVERIVKGKVKDAWFKGAPSAVKKAIEMGWLGASAFEGWLREGWPQLPALMAASRAVAEATSADFLKVFLQSDRVECGCAAAWSVAFADSAWAQTGLRETIDGADGPDMKAILCVAAVCAADFDALPEWLDTDYQTGALLGLAGWRDRSEEARRRLEGLGPRNKDDVVVREMVGAVLADAPDEATLERAWWKLLGHQQPWYARMFVKVFHKYDWPLPEAVELWLATEHPFSVPSAEWVDEAVQRATEGPTSLLARIRDMNSGHVEWRRAVALLGMSEDARALEALRHRLDLEASQEGCIQIARALAGAGRPVSSHVRARLAGASWRHTEVLEPTDASEALIAAVNGDHSLARAAGLSLNTVASEVAPYLRWLLASDDPERRQHAVQTTARVLDTDDLHVRDIAGLANSEVRHVSELSHPELLLACPAADVREMFAALLGRLGHRLEDVTALLIPLMNDEEEVVAWAALHSLASLAPGQDWVTDLILERSQSDHWEATRRGAALMASAPHPRFIARLASMADRDDIDYMARENAVLGLNRIAEKYPDRGLIVLDVRQPHSVQERYGLNEQIDWSVDQHSEATRLLLVAFDRRKKDAEIRRHIGKKVLFAAPDQTNAGSTTHLAPETFEGIAMHLGVLFADEDSGSIIAEVREAPSGEIINALLQTRSVAVARASWS